MADDKDKDIIWCGSSKHDISLFPADAKRYAGFQLRQVQQGLAPDDAKPMRTVGEGVMEIRVNIDDAFRVFYVAKFAEAVYVLHAFQKKSTQGIKTPQRQIDLIRERLKRVRELPR